jgi:ribose transport system substrate-binding protein
MLDMNRAFKKILIFFLMAALSAAFIFTLHIRKKISIQKKEYRITMIAKLATNPSFICSRYGADQAARIISKSMNINIKIDWRSPEKESGARQAEIINDAVKRGASAILISCSDPDEVTSAINNAVTKGIPVMTFDSDAPGSKRFSFYGLDDHSAGKWLMLELIQSLKDNKGNVAILGGNKNANNLQVRIKGAIDEAKKFPGIKLTGVYYNEENEVSASETVLCAMKEHPEINGWVMVGGWALYGDTLLNKFKNDPEKIKIVAINALPDEFPYIETGISPCLLAQDNYKWGYVGVSSIIEKAVLKNRIPEFIEMDLKRISKKNLGDWARKLYDWSGFKDKIGKKYLEMK